MNFYDIAMSPIEFIFLKKMRKNIISKARGNVLEIGFGTGANVNFYHRNNVKSLSAIDIKYFKETKDKFKDKVNLIEAGAENIPFRDNSFDTIVSTIAMCSVQDLNQSIREIQRVLKNDGTFLFIEHGLPKNEKLAKVFQKANPSWSKHMGGCNINREIVKELRKNNFLIQEHHKKNLEVFTYGIAINDKKMAKGS